MVFSDLPEDIMCLILNEIHSSARKTLFALLLTNQILNQVTKPFIVRDCVLDFSGSKLQGTVHRVTSWSEDKTLGYILRSIRSLTILGGVHPLELSANFFLERDLAPSWIPALITLITNLSALTEFTFACYMPIPLPLLDTLHTHHPEINLHIRNLTRRSPNATLGGDVSELALARSPILRSLHAYVYREDLDSLVRWNFCEAAFMRIVYLAPKLASFRIVVRTLYPDIEEDIRTGTIYAEQIDFRKSLENEFKPESIPLKETLKELFLFTNGAHGLVSYRDLETQLSFVDAGQLERLGCSFSDSDSGAILKPKDGSAFSSLRGLEIEFPVMPHVYSRDTPHLQQRRLERAQVYFRDFLLSVRPLVEFTLTCGLRVLILNDFLAHHGLALRILHLHEAEQPDNNDSEWSNLTRRTLSVPEIVSIRDACPNLVEFSLDINRTEDGTEEKQKYDVLSSFPCLDTININFDLGMPLRAQRDDEIHDLGVKPEENTAVEEERRWMNRINKIYLADFGEASAKALWKLVSGRCTHRLNILLGEQVRSLTPIRRVAGRSSLEMEEGFLRKKITVEHGEVTGIYYPL